MKRRRYPKPKDYPMLIPVKKAVYRVVFSEKLDGDLMGFCDSEMKLIGLSLDQTPKEMLATLMHETLHAFEAEYAVSLGHPTIQKLEWLIVDTLALFRSPGE